MTKPLARCVRCKRSIKLCGIAEAARNKKEAEAIALDPELTSEEREELLAAAYGDLMQAVVDCWDASGFTIDTIRRRARRPLLRVKLTLAVLAALGACTSSPDVWVELHYTQDVPFSISDYTEHGARAWLPLGIDGRAFDPNETTPECAERWFDAPTSLPCRITISLSIIPQSELGGALGVTERASRTTYIALELHDFEFESVVAHEVGHTVFAGDDHLALGLVGIMSANTTWQYVPTSADDDYAFAHTDGWTGGSR